LRGIESPRLERWDGREGEYVVYFKKFHDMTDPYILSISRGEAKCTDRNTDGESDVGM
jgi:hypothetical protein